MPPGWEIPMNDLELAESRIAAESPVHGPEILDELKKLRARIEEVTKLWASDDHEARMLRFALHDIETAAKAEGRPALAHMAEKARMETGMKARSEIKILLDALAEDAEDGSLEPATLKAYEPFRGSR